MLWLTWSLTTTHFGTHFTYYHSLDHSLSFTRSLTRSVDQSVTERVWACLWVWCDCQLGPMSQVHLDYMKAPDPPSIRGLSTMRSSSSVCDSRHSVPGTLSVHVFMCTHLYTCECIICGIMHGGLCHYIVALPILREWHRLQNCTIDGTATFH